MQQVWRKRWNNTGWIALGAVTLVLLVSAISRKNHKICNGIEVSFNKEGSNFFIDEKGVIAKLKSNRSLKGEAIENIDLRGLEQKLESDRWIANAELFFDNKQVLQVIVEEKEPVARVFTVSGSSFYVDSACQRLPLSEKLSARIPMFTSFPSDRGTLSRPDSEVLASAKDLAMFIQGDDFWKAQVAQIDITPNGFEMIPTVGSHVVALGKGGDWEKKFDRLFSFYKQVWTQVGLEKYEKLDVQFDGQVVATLKGAKPAKVDSVKARMAYENLLSQVKKADPDSLAERESAPVSQTQTAIVQPAKTNASVDNAATKKILPSKANILKSAAQKVTIRQPVKQAEIKKVVAKPAATLPVEKTVVAPNKKAAEKQVPKAVMKKPLAAKGGIKKGK